jgi:TonB family protein
VRSTIRAFVAADKLNVRHGMYYTRFASWFWLSLVVVGCANSSFDPNAIVDIGRVTLQPRVQFDERPVYPAEMRAQDIPGKAIVEFVVRKDGSVSDVRVVSATNALFGDAASRAVAKWLFKPARLDGVPVNCRLEVPIIFHSKV